MLTCLQCHSGNALKGPRHRRLSAASIVKQPSPFVSYACNSFFEHLLQVQSKDDEVLLALTKFLNSSNVLSWIEYIAKNSTLTRLIQAGKAFRDFFQRRSRSLPPIGKVISLLDSWSIDLIRLVTKFGNNLTASSTSIFHLIPPFCPPRKCPSEVLCFEYTRDCGSRFVRYNVGRLSFDHWSRSRETYSTGML